jgi:glycosyltransferase involved in cell wall biosynthesis
LSDASIYISDVDAKAIPANMVPAAKRHVVPNGLYTGDHSTDEMDTIRSPSIGFLGNMSYEPNINAVLWFYNNVFGKLKERFPELNFYIIGRDPAEEILNLSSDGHIHVTGTVDSIWPYVNSIDVFAIPLKKGAGLKNKILDIMSAGKPLVTSAIGNEGIYAANGKEMMLGEEAEEYIEAITTLITQPDLRESVGASAKEFVNRHFSWSSIIRDFNNIVAGEKTINFDNKQRKSFEYN